MWGLENVNGYEKVVTRSIGSSELGKSLFATRFLDEKYLEFETMRFSDEYVLR